MEAVAPQIEGIRTSRIGFAGLWLLTLPLAALSLVLTGYEFGIANNVYHVPLVLSWDQLPQFRGDAFYQSLLYFTSAIWFVLRQVVDETSIQPVFLACFVLFRIGGIFAALYLASSLAPLRLAGLALVGTGVAIAPSLIGASTLGGHGLFMAYFSQSEATWPFLLCALAETHRKRFRLATIHAAITFLLNAFVGVWLLAALCVGALADRAAHTRRDLWQLPGLWLVICLPVAYWIGTALSHEQAAAAFSFRDYVRAYYPHHFLIEAASPEAIVDVVGMAVAALLCCRELGARRLKWEVAGFALIFLIGVPLPYLVDSRLVFNLHLLRVDGVLELLFVLLALVVAWSRLNSSELPMRLSGCLLVATTINDMAALSTVVVLLLPGSPVRPAIALRAAVMLTVGGAVMNYWVGSDGHYSAMNLAAALLLMLSWQAGWHRTVALVAAAGLIAAAVVWAMLDGAGITRLGTLVIAGGVLVASMWNVPMFRQLVWLGAGAILALHLAGAARNVLEHNRDDARRYEAMADYRELTDWLRRHSDRGPLLAPLPGTPGLDENWGPLRYGLQLSAKQPVWVEQTHGAAVMWQPAYHDVWRPRYEAVRKLSNGTDFLDYAKLHEIRWMLLPVAWQGGCPGASPVPAFERGRYRVCYVN